MFLVIFAEGTGQARISYSFHPDTPCKASTTRIRITMMRFCRTRASLPPPAQSTGKRWVRRVWAGPSSLRCLGPGSDSCQTWDERGEFWRVPVSESANGFLGFVSFPGLVGGFPFNPQVKLLAGELSQFKGKPKGNQPSVKGNHRETSPV